MQPVPPKRTAIIAIVGFIIAIFLYGNLRQVTETTSPHLSQRPETIESMPHAPARPLKPGRMSSTLAEALDAYARQRNDAYLQDGMLQLRRNDKRLHDIASNLPLLRST